MSMGGFVWQRLLIFVQGSNCLSFLLSAGSLFAGGLAALIIAAGVSMKRG
jgi:hypothetical protein